MVMAKKKRKPLDRQIISEPMSDGIHMLQVYVTHNRKYVGQLVGASSSSSTKTVDVPEAAVGEVFALWNRRLRS